MGSQSDEKAIRLIQGIILNRVGETIDNTLAGALGRQIVVGLRTAKEDPKPRKPQVAYMSVPGAAGESTVIKATPTPHGTQPSAEGKGAAVKGDTVDRDELVLAREDAGADDGDFSELVDGVDEALDSKNIDPRGSDSDEDFSELTDQ